MVSRTDLSFLASVLSAVCLLLSFYDTAYFFPISYFMKPLIILLSIMLLLCITPTHIHLLLFPYLHRHL